MVTDDLGREITHDIEVVYVAGPYTARHGRSEEEHVLAAQGVGSALVELGFAPIIPHNAHYLHLIKARSYATWMDIDQALIGHCDALFRMEGESNGADEEVQVCATGWSERLQRRLPRTVYVFHSYSSLVAARDGYREQHGRRA